jgi:hypothetical protein
VVGVMNALLNLLTSKSASRKMQAARPVSIFANLNHVALTTPANPQALNFAYRYIQKYIAIGENVRSRGNQVHGHQKNKSPTPE